MGCIFRRPPAPVEELSPDLDGNVGIDYFQRDDIDISNFIYRDLEEEVVAKFPGQLKGEDFVIENCKNTKIFLFDTTAAVTIDDCIDCQIFIGPCKGSVFVRDCKECVLMVSCQQFRTRDCFQCIMYLHCTSQPVIEASMDLKFGCFYCNYPQLKEQLESTHLSPLNNNWYSVHNFTPEIRDSWSFVTKGDGSKQLSYSPNSVIDNDFMTAVSFHCGNSIIPATIGRTYTDEDSEACLVAFLETTDIQERALNFIEEVQDKVLLLITKDTKMKGNGLKYFFSDNPAAPPNLSDGRVIFLEFQGQSCTGICAALLFSNYPDNPTNVYCSPDLHQAKIDYERLSHLLDSGVSMS